MNKKDFQASIGRLMSLYKRPKDKDDVEHLKDYYRTIYDAVRHMKNYEFDTVCKEMVGEANPIKRPMPSHFLTKYRALMGQYGWGKGSVPSHEPTPAENLAWMSKTVNEEITPRAARWILKVADAQKIQFPEGVASRLVERAGDEVEYKTPEPTIFKQDEYNPQSFSKEPLDNPE